MHIRSLQAAILAALLATQLQAAAPATATASTAVEPLTRIRGVPRSIELNADQFGNWMQTVWRQGKPARYAAVGTAAAMPATRSEEFRMADKNGDGHVTKEELADYLALPTTN